MIYDDRKLSPHFAQPIFTQIHVKWKVMEMHGAYSREEEEKQNFYI